MGIVRDLYYARKMSAGLKLPAPTVALLIKRLRLAAAMGGGGVEKTVSGTLVHITDALAKAALSVLASIEPIQDLHGYANPWPAGGGVNKLPPTVAETKSENGLSCTSDGNGNFTFSGTLSGTFNQTFTDIGTAYVIQSGDYLHCLNSVASSSVLMYLYFTDNTNTYAILSTTNKIQSLSGNEGKTVKAIRFYVGEQYNATVSPMIVNSGASTAFEPWENICPISGLTGLSVYVSPTSDVADATTYSVVWTTEAGTVYGGTLDVVTGVLTVDRGCVNVSSSWLWIKSNSYPGGFYADIGNAGTGQKKNTPFMCSHAKTATTASRYVQGTCFCDGSINIRIMGGSDTVQNWKDYIDAQSAAGTPIQICYELATPLTYQLTPQEVQMLLGENYVWSSSGDSLSVTYYAEGNANTLQSLNILLGGRYSNPKTADDVSDKEALEIILGGNK